MSFQFNSPTTSTPSFATSSSTSSSSRTTTTQPFAPSPLKAGFTVDQEHPVYFGLSDASDASADLPKAGLQPSLHEILSALAAPPLPTVDPLGIPSQLWSFLPAEPGEQPGIAPPAASDVIASVLEGAQESAGTTSPVPQGIQDLAAHCELPMALPAPPLTRPANAVSDGNDGELTDLLWEEYIEVECLTPRSDDSRPSPASEYLTTPVESPIEASLDLSMCLLEDVPIFTSPTSNDVFGTSIPRVSSAEMMPPPPLPPSKTAPKYTGTRKNTNPASLIPLDAPVQPRTYLRPSATSRKDVPQSLKRKRGDEPEEVEDQIAKKRLQNTQAARRSRRRKLEHLEALETTISIQKTTLDLWNTELGQWRAWAMENGLVDVLTQFTSPTVKAFAQLPPYPTPPS